MTLSEKFNQRVRQDFPLATGKKIIMAVSGGIDSIVMMHLFYSIGQTCEVAHCNFQLRGEESDNDEKFVAQIAKDYNFQFHSNIFNTSEYAEQNKVSIQMAARSLRYEWFEKLSVEFNADYITTAHHANDNAETMMLNLIKGTGLAGMHGIKLINGKIIRPLLFTSRKEIEEYAKQQKLVWREDASNQDDYYLRNKLRHHVMPVLEDINPDFTSAMLHHAGFVRKYESLVESYLSELIKRIVKTFYNGAVQEIDLRKLMDTAAPEIVLYHILKHTGAGAVLCESIISTTDPGSVFLTSKYKIVRERETISVFSAQFLNDDEFTFETFEHSLQLPYGKIEVSKHILNETAEMKQLPEFGNKNSVFVDSAAIKFPMVIRKWKSGDTFQPLGMKGRKLISDYFIDSRFTSIMKETVYLLLSDNEVVWIVGHRPAEIFKIKETTTTVLKLTYIPNLL